MRTFVSRASCSCASRLWTPDGRRLSFLIRRSWRLIVRGRLSKCLSSRFLLPMVEVWPRYAGAATARVRLGETVRFQADPPPGARVYVAITFAEPSANDGSS
jgi:hypothetical protein